MRTLALLAVMVLTAPQAAAQQPTLRAPVLRPPAVQLPAPQTAPTPEPRDTRDAINDINQDDMRFLQQAMDQKEELEDMISESMRESGDAQSSIAPAQKD